MQKVFDLDGSIYKGLSTGYSLIILNVMVIIGSLPVITIGTSITAAYSVLDEIEKIPSSTLIRRFIIAYKEHLKKGILLFGLQSLGILIIGIILFLLKDAGMIQLIFIVLTSFFLIVSMWFYPVLSRLNNHTIKEICYYSVGLALNYTALAVLSFTLPIISILIPIFLPSLMFIWIFFLFSLPMYLQSKILQLPYAKIETMQQELNE